MESAATVGENIVADQLLAQTVVTKQKWDGSDKKKCHLWTQGLDQSFKVSFSLLHSLKQLMYFKIRSVFRARLPFLAFDDGMESGIHT